MIFTDSEWHRYDVYLPLVDCMIDRLSKPLADAQKLPCNILKESYLCDGIVAVAFHILLIRNFGDINLSAGGNREEKPKSMSAMSDYILNIPGVRSVRKVLCCLDSWIDLSMILTQYEWMSRVKSGIYNCYSNWFKCTRLVFDGFRRQLHSSIVRINMARNRGQQPLCPVFR